MSPPSRGIFVALLLVCVFASVGVATGSAGVAAQQEGDGAPEWDSGGNISMDAQLKASGDARWALSVEFNLTTESETEAYRSLAEDFENGNLPPLGLEAFETGLDGVNDRTEREMAIVDEERSTAPEPEVQSGTGRLTVEFTWQNFAGAENGRLSIDRGVLVMESGELWFNGLTDDQSLTIIAPEGYGVRDATVSAQDGKLIWEGPAEFDETTLQATFIGTNGPDPGPEPDPESESLMWVLIPIAIFGLALAVFLTRRERLRIDLPTDVGVRSLPLLGGTATEEPGQDEVGDPSPESTDAEKQESEEIDEELLSDEERVERLLSSNGGRMKQATIVKETDWSNAKVSQLLSSMEEEGRIDKLRIGRENLISFPDEDITDTEE